MKVGFLLDCLVGKVPVYQSSEVELIKMMGPKGYAELVKLCDSRMAAIL